MLHFSLKDSKACKMHHYIVEGEKSGITTCFFAHGIRKVSEFKDYFIRIAQEVFSEILSFSFLIFGKS